MSYETKILPSGIVIENRPGDAQDELKYCWFIEGTNLLHNEGKPAFEYNDGSKYWIQHNRFHRLDGPSIEFVSGYNNHYIYDVSYSKEDYWNHPKVKEYMYLKEHPELESFV